MKRIITVPLCLVLVLTALTALANEKITIGATATPHAIVLEKIKDNLKKAGYDLVIEEFSDYNLPNPATSGGDLDANYFQHLPFLNAYNQEVSEKDQLVAVIPVHYEPFGIYAGAKDSLDALKEGDHIAISNDPSNETRALLLLQDAGLIKLKDGITPDSKATALDVAENPKGLVIDEVNAELVPTVLPDVALAVINGNYALKAGLNPAKDALFLEPKEGEAGKTYTNYIVVRAADAEKPFVEALRKALETQEVYDFLLNNEEFKGGVIPAFDPLNK